MANNLLVDWLNNKKKNVQTNVLRKSATNTNNVTTPNLPIKPTTVSQTGLNLQKAQQPVQTRLNNINTQTAPTQTNTWVGSIAQNPNQSRFIGFQQQQPQAKSFNKLMNNEYLMIPTAVNQANFANAKEENRYRTMSEAFYDLQGTLYKRWNTLKENELRQKFPEFKDLDINVLNELQNELLPIVRDGKWVDADQISQIYPELLKGKELKDIEKIKENIDINNKKLQQIQTNIDKTLKTNWQSLSPNWMKYIQNWNTVLKTLDEAKKKWVVWWASNVEIIDYLAKNNPEFNNIFKELNGLELSEMDKAIVWKKDASLLKQVQNKMSQFLIDQVTNSEKPTDEEIESVMRGKEKLENDFWGQTGKKIATEIGVPVDSLEKFTYRTYKDIQNKILEAGMEYTKDYAKKELKSAFKEWLWVDLTDEQLNSIDNLYNKAAAPSINEQIKINKQNVMDYAESVNKEYESRKTRNLDPDIENYVNNMGMTRSLLQWNLEAFGYKSAGDMAQNADMLVTTALWVVAPEVVLPLMAVDSYSRESQESFEELMETQKKMWIPQDEAYDNAQKWSVIVWLASATVELALEKLIWWVETTASKAWHDAFTKEFTKKATEMMTERWLADILKQWATTQFKASLEEWLEEVLQQTIHNKAVQQYDPDQKLTEWLLQAFEWGFYNPMNLLAWGGDVFSNIDTNSIKQWVNNTVDNATARARNIVGNVQQSVNNWVNNVRDFMNRKNKVTSQSAWGNTETQLQGEQTNISSENVNKWNNTSINVQNNNIKSTNGAIELEEDTTENKKTAIKEWWLGEKVLESLNWLDENTRERIKKNPYSVEESKNLIKEMDENPWIDFRDYQNGRYEEVLDTVLKKLEQKENKRSKDIWTLYDKLEEANAPVDVTELKNKVAEFQAQAEALEDIATPTEQAQIKTILENIEKIWDWTMDVWKVRKIADKRSKRSASSSYDGIGLIWDIRDAIDDVIVKWNPDMKEVDKSYSKVLKEIWEIKWKLFYKNWWLKSNAVSTIKNMMNAGNRIDLNNLEKYIPWIKKQLQAIDDSKFVYNAYTTWKGSRFISGIARWVFGNIWKAIWFFTGWWGWLVAWAVVDAGVDTALVKLTRKALRDTITKETAASRAELERISKKIEEWEKLDAQDKARLKELGEKIKRNGEQMAKTKAEKEAWVKMMDENITPQTTEEEQEKNKVTKKKTTKKNKVTEKNNEAKNKVTKKEPVKKAEPNDDAKKYLYDKNWKIKNVYHYSDTDFRDFDLSKQKNKLGIYFSPSSKPTSKLRKYKITATIDMKNPLVISPTNKSSMIYPELKWLADDGEYDTKFRELLIRDWYDWVIMLDEKWNVSQYVVLNPEQVNVKNQWPIKKEEMFKWSPVESKNKITGTPRNKITATTEDRSDLKSILWEKLYNKLQRQLDAINESRKGIREPITMDEIRRDPEYYLNEFNKMANDELVEISDKLSKITDWMEDTHLTEDQQAQLAKAKSKKQREALLNKWREEYFERNKLSDNQIAQIEKVMEEANELVKQHDRVRAFFRDIMNEKTEMALQKWYENKVAEELYNETTWLAEKQNKADIALYDEMNAENDAIVDLFDEMKREEEFEKNLAENETPQDIRDMEEQIDYLDNILQNETLQITEAEAPQNKATTTAKNKITNVKVTKWWDIRPDNSWITGKFKNLTLKDYETMQEVNWLEDEYLEWDAELIRNMEQLRDTMYYFDPTDWDLPEDFEIDYNNWYVKDRAKFVAENQQLLDRIEKWKTTKEDIDEYEDYYDEEKKTRDTDGIIKWQKDLISEMFENSVDEAYPSNEFLDKFYDRYLDFLGDRELRETNEKLNNFWVMFNKYNRWWNQWKDYSPSQREYRAKQDFERAMNENETPQIAEEERKNKVTAKKTEATTPKQEENQTKKAESKTAEDPELREKIWDRFYNYLKEQAERINGQRKTLAPVTIRELLTAWPYRWTSYMDIYERMAREEIQQIQEEMAKLDLPQAKMTEAQREQLSKTKSQKERNDLLMKWQKEWIEKNPLPEWVAEKLSELVERWADIVEQHKKARNYIYDSQIAEENKENEDHYSEESKTKVTDTGKNKVTNPTKSKATSLFNESEVDKGNKSEWLNPDALPLSDYREMQRLNDGKYYSLSNALWKRSLKLYMAKKIATELVWNYDEIIADEFDPDNLEDKYVEAYNDVIDMYEGYEEYSDLKNDGDTDIDTLKNTLSAVNSYADKLYKWKTAKELIDQYKPEYESDLKVYNRLDKEYPWVFDNLRVDLTGAEGKARRELANQENETAQDIDYQELAERENETPQIPTIFEEDLEQMNLRGLQDNETPQDIDYQDLAELENETPQMLEEESTNKVTSNSRNKVTNGWTNLDKAIEIIKNADATKPQQWYIWEDTYARASSSDVVIKTKWDTDFNQISFYRKSVSLSEMAQNDTMFIVLNDVWEKWIENVNKVLEWFDLQYRVWSELDNRWDTVYYLENTNTWHKDYFSDEWRSEPALSKTLRDKTIVPRFTPEQQAEYDRQMEQRRKEQEAEREEERQEEENTRKANLLTYVNDTYWDNPLQRGRVLKELSELNEESDHKIHYYGDEVPDNAEVWQVLDALADFNGTFSETRESGDNYTWTYNYWDNRSINRLTKAQKNYLEYRMNIKPVQNRLQNYLDNIENKSLRTRTENVLSKKERWKLDDGKIVTWTKAQYIEWLVNDLWYRPKEFPTWKTYANWEPKIDYMIVNEKNAGYISSKIENGYAKSLLETPEEELSAEDEAKLEKELFNKKSDNSDYESRIIKDNSNYKFEDLKDADIETILSKDWFEKYTFEEDWQKGEWYAGYINWKAVDIIPNKEKNRITINVGDELFRSYDDGSINVQLNGSDEITQTSSVYDNEVFKWTLARALGTEYKALWEPKSYKYDKDNGVFAIYDKSDSDKILYEVSLWDKVMFDDGTIYDTAKHLGAWRTQGWEKHFDNKPVTEIFAWKTLIWISKWNKYASNKYTDTRAQWAVLKDMESIQELEWLLEDKNNILEWEIDWTPVKVSALDLNYNPIKMENVGKDDDYYNKVKTYKLQVWKKTDNTYFYDTFPELKSALKRIYVWEDVNKTTTEITWEKNAVTAKQVESEKPKNLVTAKIQAENEAETENTNTSQEIQEIDKDTYFDDIVKNLKDHPREMFIYKDWNYFYPHYILPSWKVLTPENTYWGEVSSEEAARNWLLKEAEEHSEENETKKAEKLKEIVGKTAEKYEATLKRIESDNPMQEIWTSWDYFKYGMGNNQMARAKKESEANAEVWTFKKDVIDWKEWYRIFVAWTKNEAIRAFYEPKTWKTYRIYRWPVIDDSKPYTTKQVERIEKFLQNVDKQLDKETKKEKKEEKQVITQEWLDSLKPDKDGIIELDYKWDERWALWKWKEALIKEWKADWKYLYNYWWAAHPQYMALYIKNGEVYEWRKGLEDQYMTAKQEAVDWLNQKEKDVEHESTERYTQTDYETLPKTISVESEAEKAWPKRIAPDRVKRQQETYDQWLESVKNVLKQSPVKIYELWFKSDRSKAVQNILEERKRIRELPETEADKQWTELAKSVYEDLVIKDISKWYRYPEDVTSKFPKAQMKKAVDARARYEKGLFTSFSAKDTRANNQYRDEIWAWIKSQDWKPVTQEQMNEIVDGIRAYSNIFGVDMKKFAEDNNVIYVHLHGGNPFLMWGMSIAWLYRRDAAWNISVSLWGREWVMEKWEDWKMKKSDIKTTTVHEITHAVDGMLEWKLFSDADTEILKKTMNKPSELINYYNRKQEIVARAVEQYAAHQLGKKLYRTALANIDWENWSVEFVEKEANYVDREAYWNQENFDKYVKPIVEKNMKEKMKDYLIQQPKNNVIANDKNKITSK